PLSKAPYSPNTCSPGAEHGCPLLCVSSCVYQMGCRHTARRDGSVPALLTPPCTPPPANQHSHQPLQETIRGNSAAGKHEATEGERAWAEGSQGNLQYSHSAKEYGCKLWSVFPAYQGLLRHPSAQLPAPIDFDQPLPLPSWLEANVGNDSPSDVFMSVAGPSISLQCCVKVADVPPLCLMNGVCLTAAKPLLSAEADQSLWIRL
ncbi:unnamed protein product, partial [Pleuronectes platessa]